MTYEIGKQLKELRARDGRTQEDVAAALGVTAQAVSRWEKAVCCPDIGLLPSIANYFDVSIDRLFGYDVERKRKIDELCEKLAKMNRENNGEDVSMSECIRLARDGLLEFPANPRVMLALADILYNAGYVRYGEFHLTDEEGYDVFDVERHKKYAEWQEAISLYERVIPLLEDGDEKFGAVNLLVNLYAVTGETEKAAKLAERVPTMWGCREFLSIGGLCGKKRSQAFEDAVIALAQNLVKFMVHCEISRNTKDPSVTAKTVARAMEIGDSVLGTGYREDVSFRAFLARTALFLADRLWQSGDDDGAFKALDDALERAKTVSAACAESQPEYFPWWCVNGARAEDIRNDPRWSDWVERCKA